MKLICIESTFHERARAEGQSARKAGGTPAPQCRGTAEIETLLVIPVLLTILLLAGGALKLGAARLANVQQAENEAYTQVVSGQGITASADPVPMIGIAAAKPDPPLPTRFDLAVPTQVVSLPLPSESSPQIIRLQDQAIFLDPTWHFAAWPGTMPDQGMLQAWYEAYVGEDHSAAVDDALGLYPAWPP